MRERSMLGERSCWSLGYGLRLSRSSFGSYVYTGEFNVIYTDIFTSVSRAREAKNMYTHISTHPVHVNKW
jgi:hypothetical protein